MSPSIPPADFFRPEQPSEYRPGRREELGVPLALGFLDEHVGTVLGGIDLIAELRRSCFVLVTQRRDLGVRPLVRASWRIGP